MQPVAEAVDFHTKKFSTKYCIDLHTRDRQVAENCARIPGRIGAANDHDGKIAVVCYGPSLEETWEELRNYKHIITCSGAHKFLIDRGIIPTWHNEVDPRPHKAELIGTPHKDVEYLVASVVHRDVLDLLEGYNVKLWHVFSHEASRDNIVVPWPRGEWSLTGGSNVGLRAIVLARHLGFRRMTLFGMDYSFKSDGTQHAGWHPKEFNQFLVVEADGKEYYTNVAMLSYAQSFFHEVCQLGMIEVEVRGEGLMQAKIREAQKDNPDILTTRSQIGMIAAQTPHVLSPEYLKLQQQLHENPAYGISGSVRVGVVKALIEKTKPQSVLDYGCGKGTLAQSLPIPIWEYDPAIPGKDKPARPADLVICTDVLEHIEPEYLNNVLLDLNRVTLKVCYAVIHTGPAAKTLADGRNAHLIQETLEWWKTTLSNFFEVAKIEQKGIEIEAILGPKKLKSVEAPKAVRPPDTTNRITPARHKGTEVKFYTPNPTTEWRARSLFKKELSTIEWIETFQKGETLWDVGANVGGYAVWASARRGARVYAFEPEAENYALLCKNMRLNNVEGAAYCVAVTNSEDVLASLHLSGGEAGGSCNSFGEAVGHDLKPRKGGTQGAVGFKLDHLATRLPLPDHIKIDVDGFEHLVIQGGQHMLKEVKSLLVEVNTNLPEHQEMVNEIAKMGFVCDQVQVERSMRKDGAFKGCAEVVFRRAA